MFYFCKVFQHWSRILTTSGPDGSIVEVNLTPEPASQTWDEHVKPICFRQRFPSKNDGHPVAELPEEVKLQMLDNLGMETTGILIGGELLSPIDWNRYPYVLKGGWAHFKDLCKSI